MRIAWAPLLLVLAGCGSGSDDSPAKPPIGFDSATRDELSAAGVDKYLGAFTPSGTQLIGGDTVYEFAQSDDGPTCIEGDPYLVSVRDTGSNDLLFFLQGGGACHDELCLTRTVATAGVPTQGWTLPDPEVQPLASFNVVFASYCDGSVFAGDNLFVGSDGSLRRHRGLANLSAALDLAKSLYPEPERIVLAGVSAGAYGTIFATLVLRLVYPDTPLFVLNDAGLGLTNPESSTLVDAALEQWKVGPLIPPSCSECWERDQFTALIGWALDRDRSLKVSAFSTYNDAIISLLFLSMSDEAFEQLLLSETGELNARHPQRFQRFFVEGDGHTSADADFANVAVDGTRLVDWVGAMLDGSPEWRDLLE